MIRVLLNFKKTCKIRKLIDSRTNKSVKMTGFKLFVLAVIQYDVRLIDEIHSEWDIDIIWLFFIFSL